MKNIFSTLGLAVILSAAGCTKYNRFAFSSGSVECQRIEKFWRELETDKVKLVAFFGEDNNEPIDECPFEEFKAAFYHLTGCCFSMPHPLANEWVEYNRLECIQQYLENESVQRIAFYDFRGQLFDEDTKRPEDWGKPWVEIIEPKRIKEVTKLLLDAMEKDDDRFANEVSPQKPMQIITDKHKFIVYFVDYNNAIRGIGWTSYELRKKLTKWGFLVPK